MMNPVESSVWNASRELRITTSLRNSKLKEDILPCKILPWFKTGQMISEILTPHLKRHILYANKFRCLHYTWDYSKQRVTPSSNNVQNFVRFTTLLNLIHIFLQLISIFGSASTSMARIQST